MTSPRLENEDARLESLRLEMATKIADMVAMEDGRVCRAVVFQMRLDPLQKQFLHKAMGELAETLIWNPDAALAQHILNRGGSSHGG